MASSLLAGRSTLLGRPSCTPRHLAIRPSQIQPAPARRQLLARAAKAAVLEPESKKKPAEEEEEDEFEDGPDFAPTTAQVQGILSVLVEETDIVDMQLKIGSFRLNVRRSLEGGAASAAASAAAAPAHATAAASDPAPSPPPYQASVDESMDETFDEALIFVTALKVGIFHRGRYAAGKRIGKSNVVNEGDTVKKGQLLGYVEQLGTMVPVEAPQAGEVCRFQVEDGAPVEYKQPIVALSPFFGGHIIGDSKYL